MKEYFNRKQFEDLKFVDPQKYDMILNQIVDNHFSRHEEWDSSIYVYEYWIRLSKTKRVLAPDGKWSFGIEQDALRWAEVVMYLKAYEVDRIETDGSSTTIFVSEEAGAILNDNQIAMF